MTGRPMLSRALLPVGGAVASPTPAMLALPERAVQFGTGALLRGLVDACLDEANAHGRFNGRVVMIGSTGSGRDAQLNAQDGLYTLVSQGLVEGEAVREVRVVGAVSRALVAAEDWDEILRLAESETLECIFSNTTEVGITLDADDAAGAPARPRSFPGRLTRFLEHRARHFAYDPARAPVVIPCELIERNGGALREIVRTLARAWGLDARFHAWLERVAFCDTLVDRIVPGAPPAAQREALADSLGYDDAMLTMCEPYRLFAIQGDAALRARLGFAGERGVVVAPDIAPYRERKVRLLNGAHTALVSLALVAGCRTVREAVTDAVLGAWLRGVLFDEILPGVQAPEAAEFAHAVLDRFANPHVEHALLDITLQGTMKMRVRVVPSILAYAARTGHAPRGLALAFAGYLAFQRGAPQRADDAGLAVRERWATVGDDAAELAPLVRDVCADRTLWGDDLTCVPGFTQLVTEGLAHLVRDGVPAALGASPAVPA